ncbi:hypothetical protein L6R53_30720 [Myxococcota bacterium]|nr:hypothetical protein [Myxococcota bacterium]
MLPLLLLAWSCTSSSPTGPAPEPPAPAPAVSAPPVEAAGSGGAPPPPQAQVAAEEGWGAILWREDTWYSTGQGTLAAGPKEVVTLAPTGGTGACGAVVADPQGAMITLKAGAVAPTITPAPAIQAALVERAAWRLDELLPEVDRFTPLPTSPDPSKARGVDVGSVAKVRRHGAPPMLIAAGHRECTGMVAILSTDAGQVLAWDSVADACEPLRVLPPNDLDGDGHRELAAWSRSRAVLYRLTEAPGSVTMVRLADWTCR